MRLAHSRATVVLTSGNHDSAQRLGFSARLIDAAGVHLRTDASGVGAPVVLDDEHGPVAVHGIPYLDPHAVAEPWQLERRSHEAALTEAMRRVRADLVDQAGRPLDRPGPRLRRRRDPQRLRARHHRRRRLAGADVPVRRHRLRRPRPPPRRPRARRPPALQRLAARLLLLRGHAPQGLVGRRPRRAVEPGSRDRSHLPRRPGAAPPRAAPRHPRDAAHRPRPGTPRGRLGRGDPDRHRATPRRHGAPAPPFPPRPGAVVRLHPHPSRRTQRTRRPTPGATTTSLASS